MIFTRYRIPLLGALSCRPSVSPEPSAANMLLLILWPSPKGYRCRERGRAHCSFLSIHDEQSCLVYDVFIIVFICIFYATRIIPGIFVAYSCDAYILIVRCMKQNKDAVLVF